jgi:phosphatidylethanolamine-binding protein (PEBP) family uncharacterized protein
MTAASAVAVAGELRITSPSFEQNAVMPPGLTCDGSGGQYLHWALWDLPPETTRIAGQRLRGLNENGPGGYLPACPPNGEHRYVFQLCALDALIGNPRISNEADLRRAMEGHVLDQAELVGRRVKAAVSR